MKLNMAENSKIEWTTHTFNPWHGCIKVSAGCEHCYAETLTQRWGGNFWGPAKTTQRRLFGSKHWLEPLKWDKKAAAAGERHRVFCASMADVFEDHPQVVEARSQLFELIDRTPHLDWLLLTKRPENIERLWPWGWYDEQFTWANVWIGTSVENQEMADKRIPELLKVPAKVRFLSCEPLLEPVDLRHVRLDEEVEIDALTGNYGVLRPYAGRSDAYIHWVIVGGESGPNARPMHPDWARSLREQCVAAGVPFHFKQWGEWYPDNKRIYQVRSMHFGDTVIHKLGKHAAGRLLDGREWNEFPASKVTA
jgi:protein gp37